MMARLVYLRCWLRCRSPVKRHTFVAGVGPDGQFFRHTEYHGFGWAVGVKRYPDARRSYIQARRVLASEASV